MVSINTKMEYWKNRLLDLGKRNRLVNCQLPKSGGRVSRVALLIHAPVPALAWNSLQDSDTSIEFPIPVEDYVEEFDDDSDIVRNEQLLPVPVPDGDFRNGNRTNQVPKEAVKTLRTLMKKAKEFTEEKGLNALYLAFGFLNWRENGVDGQEMRSPLLLVPVQLSQESLTTPILLSRSDEEITTNNALEQKLFNDFGITLPSFDESEDWQSYLAQVQDICSDIKWRVESDVTQLSIFSFLKMNMYHDLERNADKITAHHIVRSLSGEIIDGGVDCSDVGAFKHDAVDPQEEFSVVDADSSQQDAILLAKRGVSFVLQGPPGTGKSQTITNIIAELIADGKKVLFVSEKTAALDVVYKRLTQAGLGNFCLTLHSHNAKRREILDQLGISLKLSRHKAELQQEAFNQLHRLKDVRSALNAYADELHTSIVPLGSTIYQVNGRVALYEDFKNIDYKQDNVENFTHETLSRCKSALEELSRIVEKSGYQQDNPWSGCVLTSVTHEFRQQFLVDASKTLDVLDMGIEVYRNITRLLGAALLPTSFNNVSSFSDILSLAEKSPVAPVAWLKHDLREQISKVKVCLELLAEIAKLRDFSGRLKPSAETLSTIIVRVAELPENTRDSAWQEVSDSFSLASRDILTLLPEGAMSAKVAAFGTSSALYRQHADKMTRSEAQKKELQEELSKTETVVKDEREKLRLCETNWDNSRLELLTLFDENVLAVDIDAMLSRYRTAYRSGFSRLFNAQYKGDRKTLLGFCKSNTKMPYAETLSILDKLSATAEIKRKLEEQRTITNDTIVLRDNLVRQLADNESALCSSTERVSLSKQQLEAAKHEALTAVDACVIEYKTQLNGKAQDLQSLCATLRETLTTDISETADFVALKSNLEWALEFQTICRLYALTDDFAAKVCERDNSTLDTFRGLMSTLIGWKENAAPWLDKYARLFEQSRQEQLSALPLVALKQTIQDCYENFAALEYLIDYRNAERLLASLGIDAYLVKAKELNLAYSEIVPVFDKCFYRSWLDAVMPTFAAVSEFRRERQDGRVSEFKQLDKERMEISKAALVAKLIARLPNFDSFSAGSGEVALLRREMGKQRKLMPTRKLIAAIPNLLPTLKPCMMMSPLSVSTYLGSSGYEFDTVIFDEASQVRTEDAICSVFRAKQAIIAGDSKQLPPTDFFASSINDSNEYDEDDEGEINDTGAFESLLDEATMLPTQTLLWHYRSKHEHLIAFSNAKIYQGSLITFPSSLEKTDNMGVEYIHVPGGMYDRGGKNGNKLEAERIAELVFEHFRTSPNRSLGIIAFGEVQQNAIEESMLRKRRENLAYENFFKDDLEESLFIKNLETVQGDERDTIIFSIGYAPDAGGKFIMNFGPLSRNGGERRLNVAVTRARYNLKLVGSILPTDIITDRTRGLGPKLLRQYIDFAINGAQAILGEISNVGGRFDSPFEESVYGFLVANGYDVATQVGCSGYRIDMAIRHPKYEGRFTIGIECDGAAYHSARTARERDRLRQTVLEDMGWKFYRIWSTDWIKDRYTEGERLLAAIKRSIDEYHEEPKRRVTEPSAKHTDFLNVSQKSVEEVVHEKYNSVRSRYALWKADEIPLSDFEETMLRVLDNNFGLDKAGLFKETAQFGYLWKRQGSTIQSRFEFAFRNLLTQEKIEDVNGKIKIRNI